MNKSLSESGYRSRSYSSPVERHILFWRGLPSAILAVLGLGALVFAADRGTRLEQRYQRWAEDSSKKREELSTTLLSELRMLQTGQTNKSIDELIPPEDKRRQKLAELWSSEQLYYEKLIALNPANSDYRFQFAVACLNSANKGDVQRGLSLLQALAPLDQPGYPKAHLWWIDHLTQLVRLRQISPQQGAELIYVHADNCLKRQSGDKIALQRKGEVAFALGRNDDALGAYSLLFQDDPIFYSNLININRRLNKTETNAEIYRVAKSRFEAELQRKLSVDKWMKSWEALLNCMIGLDEHELAATRLREEITRQGDQQNSSYQSYLQQLLAKVLVATLRNGRTEFNKFSSKDIELMKEAHELDSKNPDVLQLLTSIALSEDAALAEEARKIYDPTKDESPTQGVLNEMGTMALARKDYDKAAAYLEKSLQLEPQNSQTLNNLAYVYLVGNNRDPERALKLVDEAIRSLTDAENLTYFLDTKATALMQLNRLPDAIATYELALKDRPDNVKIIEALIKCYEASNLSAEAYKEQLKRLTENKQP